MFQSGMERKYPCSYQTRLVRLNGLLPVGSKKADTKRHLPYFPIVFFGSDLFGPDPEKMESPAA